MASAVVTPVDQLTGLPLPLAPPAELLSESFAIETNWHHHAHPRRSPLLQGVGGLAIRNARLQLADVRTHNAYHAAFDGPPLPATGEERFRFAVMACAGYVPDTALDFSGDSPQIVPIDHIQRNRLWQSGELKTASMDSVRKFMKEHVLKQDLWHLREYVIDEFLYTKDAERRYFLGNLLLAKAIEQASEPINPAYRIARDEGLIHPALPRKMPTFVNSAIGKAKRRQMLVQELHAKVSREAA